MREMYYPVRMSRKGAFLLLLVAVLWSALPATACLLPSAAGPGCCRAMPPDCPMQNAGSVCACAPVHQDHAAIAPEAPVLSAHTAACLTRVMNRFSLHASASRRQLAFAAPPPDPSPGKLSVLRI